MIKSNQFAVTQMYNGKIDCILNLKEVYIHQTSLYNGFRSYYEYYGNEEDQSNKDNYKQEILPIILRRDAAYDKATNLRRPYNEKDEFALFSFVGLNEKQIETFKLICEQRIPCIGLAYKNIDKNGIEIIIKTDYYQQGTFSTNNKIKADRAFEREFKNFLFKTLSVPKDKRSKINLFLKDYLHLSYDPTTYLNVRMSTYHVKSKVIKNLGENHDW